MTNMNPQQLEAVKHVDGPCLVIAGPGSGKTTVITHRTKYLVTDCKKEAGSILAVSYTHLMVLL